MNNEYFFEDLVLNDIELDYEEKINIKRTFSEYLKKAKLNAKLGRCYTCGKEMGGFCSSHLVPKFCLKNISADGKIYYSNKLLKFPTAKEEMGINEASTFRLICSDCDSQLFKDYEDEKKYGREVPSENMLAEITMKNYLKAISERMITNELYKQIFHKCTRMEEFEFLYQRQKIIEMDLKEYKVNYERARKILKKSWGDEYFILFYEKLNYVVPIAFQGRVALVCDLEGNIINNVYNHSLKYEIQDIHICILPLKRESVILMYSDNKSNSRYRKFNKQFRKLELQDKLSVINYIIFAYAEDIFIAKSLREDVLEDENLINTSRKTGDLFLYSPYDQLNLEEALKKQFSFEERENIPNILSEEYKMELGESL